MHRAEVVQRLDDGFMFDIIFASSCCFVTPSDSVIA